MTNIIAIIIQLLSGALGGYGAGSLLKKLSLGSTWNSIIGILGGGLGGQILGWLGIGTGDGGLDLSSIIGSILGGGVGGGVLLSIIGFIKSLLGKK
ncbi:MAG: GlsB/YeaQ/YmgE family stress response membrane protein [Bacteroidales bacterium]|jgi:hypothetical protein|nr:GlsB/YeaQ/YmgE family stress response membrane protein [Bacteroidales bacterium]